MPPVRAIGGRKMRHLPGPHVALCGPSEAWQRLPGGPTLRKWLNAFATHQFMIACSANPGNGHVGNASTLIWDSIKVEVSVMRPRTGKTKRTLECPQCGDSFVQYRPWQKFCSEKCRWRNWSQKHPRLPPPGTDGKLRFPRHPRRKPV